MRSNRVYTFLRFFNAKWKSYMYRNYLQYNIWVFPWIILQFPHILTVRSGWRRAGDVTAALPSQRSLSRFALQRQRPPIDSRPRCRLPRRFRAQRETFDLPPRDVRGRCLCICPCQRRRRRRRNAGRGAAAQLHPNQQVSHSGAKEMASDRYRTWPWTWFHFVLECEKEIERGGEKETGC